MFKTGEKLIRACENHGSFLDYRKHEMVNGFPRQSTDATNSAYQTQKTFN